MSAEYLRRTYGVDYRRGDRLTMVDHASSSRSRRSTAAYDSTANAILAERIPPGESHATPAQVLDNP